MDLLSSGCGNIDGAASEQQTFTSHHSGGLVLVLLDSGVVPLGLQTGTSSFISRGGGDETALWLTFKGALIPLCGPHPMA